MCVLWPHVLRPCAPTRAGRWCVCPEPRSSASPRQPARSPTSKGERNMNERVSPEVVVARVETDADIAEMVDVASRSELRLPPPRPENLRHQLDARPNLRF